MPVSVLRPLFQQHFPWSAWEMLIAQNGLTIDRPSGVAHPDYPHIIYPLDYGYINHTQGGDQEEVDVFVGSEERLGLVGLILTQDHRKGDREVKLLYRTHPREIYLAHGFINYDRSLLQGLLVLRQPMHTLWETSGT